MATSLMPPVGIDPGAETDEERRQRVARISPLPPVAAGAPQPTSQPASPSSIPPKPASTMPPVPGPEKAQSGDLASFNSDNQPAQPRLDSGLPRSVSAGMPPVQAGPEMRRYNELSAQGAPELHGWKKAADVIGSLFKGGQAIEQAIPGSPQNYEAKLGRAAMKATREQGLQAGERGAESAAAKAQFETPEKRRAYLQQHPDEFEGASDFEKNDFVLAGKFPQREPTPPKQANLQQDYAAAVEDAQKRGVDPASDPKVQQISDAITSLQKQPAAPKDMTAKAGTLNGKPAWAIQTDQGWIDPETRKPVHGFQPQQPAGSASATDISDVTQGIMSGDDPPDLMKYGYRDRTAIAAELKRKGFNLAAAQQDWTATQKHLATLNGAQQERLRQAVSFTDDSLGILDNLYSQWQKVGPTSGWKVFNKASLATSKQLPGEAGNLAHRLDAQISDLTSELGTVYKGGNSSTDESLKLAAKNLESDWNEKTFKDSINQIRQNLEIRKNSIKHSQPAGVSENSLYTPKSETEKAKDFGAAPDGRAEGSTGKLTDGTKVVVKGGRIVAAQ